MSFTEIPLPPPLACPQQEMAILGAALLKDDAAAYVAETLTPADFDFGTNRLVMSAIQALVRRGEPVDTRTVEAKLLSRDLPAPDGGWFGYLVRLADACETTKHAEGYAGKVLEYAARRRMRDAGGQITGMASDLETPIEQLVGDAGALVEAARPKRLGGGLVPAASLVPDLLDRICSEERRQGLTSGLEAIDRKVGGWETGLIILGALPSVGKTALAGAFATNAAETGAPVAFFSLEMTAAQIMARMTAARAKVNSRLFRFGGMDEFQRVAAARAAGWLGDLPLMIDDRPRLTVAEIRLEAREMQRRDGLGLVIIDHMHRAGWPAGFREPREAYTEMAAQMKSMAKELDVPVIALAQLTRDAAKRDGPPRLSDLRESGMIEAEADVVLLLHRPSYAKPEDAPDEDDPPPDVTEVIVAKNREGAVGEVRLLFWKQHSRFESLNDWHDDREAPPERAGRYGGEGWDE
jgi:replicative DNA helicase